MPQELYRWYIEELEDDPDSYYFYLDGAVATSNAVNIYIDPTAVPDADAEIWRIFASPKKDYYTIETKDGFAKWALPNMDDKYVQIQLLSDIVDSQQPLINRQHNHLWSIVHADD
ncbi:hypothetical protein EW026_g4016 [Hermanssonia centrifuga]|uniref:Uncharacterized protein n=1 Tax=Hermanssonia centrifuga TaxID=98765 RepID=A0A4V3XAH6_9APHY|nr:hypothetical protein EW026_g4016 [Hermanssonia centrifuga]